MGIAWAAVVWWSFRASDSVLVTTAVLVGLCWSYFDRWLQPAAANHAARS